MRKEIEELSPKEIMKKYPRITAHIIAESLDYATPSCAARILKDAREGKNNYCEWILSHIQLALSERIYSSKGVRFSYLFFWER